MTKQKIRKRRIWKFVSEYTFHLWIILFLCNIVIIYAVHYSTRAQTNTRTDIATSPTPTVAPDPEPTVSPTPIGQVIQLSFSMPGIGSGGGNMRPNHKARPFTLLLYEPDVNSQDKNVKPKYTAHGEAVYDDDPYSPTYTSFINKYFDLELIPAEDNYQFVIKTPQALAALVKKDSNDVGGEILSPIDTPVLPRQTMIPGDIAPAENIMNIDDYNLLVNCFAEKSKSSACPDKLAPDLDDNGVVDGLDYNLMLISFQSLVLMGFPPPALPSPTPAILKNLPGKSIQTSTTNQSKSASLSAQMAKTAKTGNAGGVILGIIFFLLLLGGGAFALFKLKLHKKAEEMLVAPEELNAEVPQEDQAAAPTNSGDTGAIDGIYYVKKESADEKGKALWLSLTNDNGKVSGHYKGSEATEGFARIKGEMQKDNDKSFIEISEILPAE